MEAQNCKFEARLKVSNGISDCARAGEDPQGYQEEVE